tara:strand:- start:240 stop:638 length:399 start_codon:yes stop_codon:yes gene_type:complete
MVGVMRPPTIQAAVGMAATVVSRPASMEPMSVEPGQVTIASTLLLVKTTVAVTVQVTLLILGMAGAIHPQITPVVGGMVAIAVSPRVLMGPTRVALWDTLATIQTHVKTVPVVALNHLGINLTRTEQNTYKS